jgi:hypothetical protein
MNPKESKLYRCQEIADMYKQHIITILSKISRNKIEPVKVVGKQKYYSLDQFDKKKEVVVVYYPIKTTETFHIYESKLNTMQL